MAYEHTEVPPQVPPRDVAENARDGSLLDFADPVPPSGLDRWARSCDALGATTKKLEKRAILAEYLKSLPVFDAARAALFIAGMPFAEIDRRNLSVGGALLTKAVAARSGADPEAMAAAYRHHGDIGAAAETLIVTPASGPPLLLGDLEAAFAEIAAARGPAAKLRLLHDLLLRATAPESKYILKLISGDMRIGVKQSLVEEAIAAGYGQEVGAVRHAGMLLGNLPEVVERAAAGTLEEASMRLFHALGFMLASPVDSVDEAVVRFAEEVVAEERGESPAAGLAPEGSMPEAPEQLLREALMEDKYDGIRAQLHGGDPAQPGRVGLFSRNREDLSAAFPDLIEAFSSLSEPVILDGEILAWSPETARGAAGEEVLPARALPFSSLQQRLGRKVVPPELRRTLPVVFMAFDILFHNDELTLSLPLSTRRQRLEQYIATYAARTDPARESRNSSGQAVLFADDTPPERGFARLLLSPAITLQSGAQLDAAYGEARLRGNEGVMLKASHSLYQPGRRGLAWLKLKRQLATLDVVVTGAEFGTGRRARHLSDYTFAVRGTQGELLNVGKAYSGVTDAEMHALSEHFTEHTLVDFGHFRTVEPDTIFEVAFNNVTRSDRHNSGFALRFPRILRIRTDKPVDEIDTLARVAAIYDQQPDRPVDLGSTPRANS